jgi:tetratricopeptide (TPR) repeat protein
MTLRWLATWVLLAMAIPAIAGEPYRPAQDDSVLLRLPHREDPALAPLWAARKAMREQPGVLQPALRFARLAIEAGRQLDDPRYLSYAEAAIAPWNGREAPAEVRVLRATLAQNRHDFDVALADLQAVLDDNPRHAQARLTRAVIHKVRGDPAAALRDCAALVGAASPLVVATCTADAGSLIRRPAAALAYLVQELERAPEAPVGERLWALTVRAEIAERLGWPEAEAYFREAFAATDAARPDPYLLNAYADFLLEAGRPAEARALLLDHATLDDARLRLAIAEQALLPGQPRLRSSLEAHRLALAQRFEQSRRRGDTPHLRELARYLLQLEGDAEAALPVALENWASQKEPADALLVLEAAAAAGVPEAAQPVHDWLAETGLEDQRVQRRIDAS